MVNGIPACRSQFRGMACRGRGERPEHHALSRPPKLRLERGLVHDLGHLARVVDAEQSFPFGIRMRAPGETDSRNGAEQCHGLETSVVVVERPDVFYVVAPALLLPPVRGRWPPIISWIIETRNPLGGAATGGPFFCLDNRGHPCILFVSRRGLAYVAPVFRHFCTQLGRSELGRGGLLSGASPRALLLDARDLDGITRAGALRIVLGTVRLPV